MKWSLLATQAFLLFVPIPSFADESNDGSEKAPFERLLKGSDAERARQLRARLQAAEQSEDFESAIQNACELVALRQRVQGDGHWESIDEKQNLSRLQTIASLTAEDRAEWKSIVADGQRAHALGQQGRYAQALSIWESVEKKDARIFGADHPQTALSQAHCAHYLSAMGRASEALSRTQSVLAIRRRFLGEEHPRTADAYEALSFHLGQLGKSEESLAIELRALALYQSALGEEHPKTATCFNNLAATLVEIGRPTDALVFSQRALEIRTKLLGAAHPDTAHSYNVAGSNLSALGRGAEAHQLFLKALEIRRNNLGNGHPDTAVSYNKLGLNLLESGRASEAQPFLEQALEIRVESLGEEHPGTAQSLNNLAYVLGAQGRSAEALPHLQKALAIYRKTYGESDDRTAGCYHNLGFDLEALGRLDESLDSYRRALEIRRKTLGDDHPKTAMTRDLLAGGLASAGRAAEVIPYARAALESRRVRLGEAHGLTAQSYCTVAYLLVSQGDRTEGRALLERGLSGYEASRLAGAQGIDRAVLPRIHPGKFLSALDASSDPAGAWRHFERTLARGLLDQQAGGAPKTENPTERVETEELKREIAEAQREMAVLLAQPLRTSDEEVRLRTAIDRARAASDRISLAGVRASQQEVADPNEIQGMIPPDGAIVFWNDASSLRGLPEEHWGCVVRSNGDPHWERLPGIGAERTWTAEDRALATRYRGALAAAGGTEDVAALGRSLFEQRLAPLVKHLDGVRALTVVAIDAMAGVPVEVLAPQFMVHYVPSGSVLVRTGMRLTSAADGLLTLGDPVFGVKPSPSGEDGLPPGGLLIVQVVQGGAAAQARLQPGDVIVRYGDVDVDSVKVLDEAIAAGSRNSSNPVTVWRSRESTTFIRDVPPGKLGVSLSKEPARKAIASRRKTDAMLLSLRGGDWKELPGTRVEVTQIAKLFGSERTTAFVDSAASEQSLEEMRKSGDLMKYRYLHFATHGEGNNVKAFESALILSQDKLPKDPLPKAGEPFLNGQLSAREVLDYWKLDAELVTLSACETAVGKSGGGDGMLGFAQAFLTAGARAVCLSLWKVDDTATSLLMTRFYQNLLGKRPGLEKPMGKAAALHEAKQWLRELSSEEALKLTASATNGVVRASRGKGEELKLILPKPDGDVSADAGAATKPFAHPKYWAAFILIGDPN